MPFLFCFLVSVNVGPTLSSSTPPNLLVMGSELQGLKFLVQVELFSGPWSPQFRSEA